MNRHERRKAKRLQSRRSPSQRSVVLEDLDQIDELKSTALSLVELSKFDAAENILKRALDLAPSDPDVHHFLGIAAYRSGRFDLATSRLAEAIRLAPTYAEAHNNLGIILLEGRQLDQAAARFECAIKLKPNYAAAYANLGNARRQLGELDAAIASYRRAIAINGNHKEAHYWLAGVLISKGDFDAATQICRDCLRIDPLCQHALAYSSIAAFGLAKEESYDFSNMIAKMQINVDAAALNKSLIADIRTHPTLKWEPYDRVTRGGWVTRDLLSAPTPSIDKFESALRCSIDEYIKSMPLRPGHPFFGTAPTNYRLTLIASILQDGGRHPPHVHEGAWLSGVYYAQIPPTINASDDMYLGWLEFGRPNVSLPAELDLPIYRIAPEAGTIVMFPSYMFHNTVPYLGPGERIGVAFDAYRIS